MLFKKKSIEIHPHEVLRKDWENVLDALFRNTIANSVKGIGIICNTSREHPDDGEGIVQEELIYHIKQKRADEVRTQLKKMFLCQVAIMTLPYSLIVSSRTSILTFLTLAV